MNWQAQTGVINNSYINEIGLQHDKTNSNNIMQIKSTISNGLPTLDNISADTESSKNRRNQSQ
jgi:hypothetical protein